MIEFLLFYNNINFKIRTIALDNIIDDIQILTLYKCSKRNFCIGDMVK